MSLFTKGDLLAAIPDAYILLATDDSADSDTTDAVFGAILVDASAWINGYLEQACLTLPDPPPARLKHIGVKYAEYALHRRRNNAVMAERIYDEWIRPAMKWLERIATGSESLVSGETTVGGLVSEPARFQSENGSMMV